MIQKRVQDLIKAAQKHIAASRWYEAKEATDQAKKQDLKKSQKTAINELYRRLDAEGQRQLTQAKQDYAAKRYLQAIQAYERIFGTFKPLPASVAAYQALKQARSDPAARAAILEAKAATLSKEIDEILAKCNKAPAGDAVPTPSASDAGSAAKAASRVEQIRQLPIARQAEAIRLLEVLAGQYGKTPTGQQAAYDLKSLGSDEALMAAVTRYRATEEARSAYAEAEAYLAVGMQDKAMECLETLMKHFPDTPAATDARKKRAEILAESGR